MSEDTLPTTDADRASQALLKGLERIARERARVRAEDWQTLFRQLRTILIQLATHPFVVGDMQAELLIERLIESDDLEEFDVRVDDFASYAVAKLEYNAALRAAANGEHVEDVPTFVAPQNSTTEVTRAAAVNGPSGSDFVFDEESDADSEPVARRSVLRL